MSALEFGKPKRRFVPGRGIVYFILLILLGAGGYFLVPRFEWHKPQVKLTPDTDAIGLAPLEVEVTEQGTGLKSFAVIVTAGGTDYPLANEQYDQPTMQKKFTVALSSKLIGLKEGPAVLRVSAKDRSLWNFFRGNETVLQKNVMIDITPPTLELLADDRYVNFGGVGLIVYKPSADTVTSGIKIGNYFFPGYKGQIKEQPDSYLAFFAHPYNVEPDQRATLVATDKAGNTRELKLAYELKNVKYKKSTIPISDEFLQNKVTPLLNDVAARQGSPKDVFIRVNKGLRKENEDKIKAITEKSTPKMLWSGAFSQLSNSKVEANFADARTYVYKNEAIDNAYHLGYDLSVTKHYPAEAANSGVVAFTGDLGIYGNTVIIDHGLGLFTLYSHLSSIDVKVGDPIKQRQVIGKTGDTGFAAGDHLHYGVYLDGLAILPVEWWDEKWIRDNVEPKLQGKSSESVQEEKKSARKAARKHKS
ncbi:MAG TPA: M23 family metallopeptidase [Candidatus Limnocylindrales bacterium]|nr:M23 family metallopeptidase [Candidatus Limnocylindrales bacterium]